MSTLRLLAPLLLGCVLISCGLRVPEIAETGDRVAGQQLVEAILINITCELRDAVSDIRAAYPQGTFIDSYGIQTTLTLTYEEKGTLGPTVNWFPPSPATAVFNVGAGLNLSSDATRKNVIDGYYLVTDLQNARCSDAARPNGPFLLQSDLKLSDWLFSAVRASMTNTVNFKSASLATKDSILQHEVKFIIDTSVNATPTWKFKLVTVDPSGTFLSLDRSRTNDLLITLGPAVQAVVAAEKKNGRVVSVVTREPARRAADLHQTANIANGIDTAVTNALKR
jgi:hypothetical protein